MSESQSPEQPAEPGEEQTGGLPDEPRRERIGRHLHRARLYTGAVSLVGLLAVLIVLISVNTRAVKLSWAFGSTNASLVWIILATAVIGWLIGITTATIFHRRTRRRL